MSVMLRTEAILPISEKLLTSYFMPVITFRILEPFPPEDTALDCSTFQYSIIWANDL